MEPNSRFYGIRDTSFRSSSSLSKCVLTQKKRSDKVRIILTRCLKYIELAVICHLSALLASRKKRLIYLFYFVISKSFSYYNNMA